MAHTSQTIAERILAAISDAGGRARSGEIVAEVAREAGTSESAVRSELSRMLKAGTVAQPKYGYYSAPSPDTEASGTKYVIAARDPMSEDLADLRAWAKREITPDSSVWGQEKRVQLAVLTRLLSVAESFTNHAAPEEAALAIGELEDQRTLALSDTTRADGLAIARWAAVVDYWLKDRAHK